MADTRLLFHVSDIHFGLEDDRSLDWVMQEIAEKRPAAVAITGDLTMRARHREFDAACRWIQALDVPVTVEVGNHDLPYFNLIERFATPYKRFDSIERLVERKLDLPGLAIVSLKTVRRWQPRWPWSHGWVTERALERTLAEIDRLPRGTVATGATGSPGLRGGSASSGTSDTCIFSVGTSAMLRTRTSRRSPSQVISLKLCGVERIRCDSVPAPIIRTGPFGVWLTMSNASWTWPLSVASTPRLASSASAWSPPLVHALPLVPASTSG